MPAEAAAFSDVPLIQTRELTKSYGSVLALDALSISLRPGVIGLVGANGAGKSTVIKILLGLLPPTSGSASLLGFDVLTEGPLLRQYVGYMPEHDCLPLDVTANDFVVHMAQISGLPRAAARERTSEVLRHVGLFEERYREMRGYSTGMKQRAKLAQAVVHDPRLLMLDEPTNGLDPAGRDEMLDLISRIGRDFGMSILMSSHLLGEIERVCDYLVVIDTGRLMRADSIASFTSATEVLTVRVDERADELEQNLRRRGIPTWRNGEEVLLRLQDEPYDAVRDEIASMGIGLLRMEQRRHRLEDLFRAAEADAPDGLPVEVA